MINHQPPSDIITHNQTELDALAWSIKMSLGQFRIYFARCNYIRLRARLVEQLRARLVEQLRALTSVNVPEVNIRVVEIKELERTLYSRIQAELGEEKPDAVMVLGLEAVEDSRQLLSATNQVREEFCKHFSFPLVLWVNDQGVKDFLTYAPDFQSWGITSHFLRTRRDLIAVLRENIEEFFAGSLRLTVEHCWEINQATQELPEADYQGNPELAATVETLRGLIQAEHPSHSNLDQALIHYQKSADLWQNCNQLERQGKLLQELAICYSLKATSIEDSDHSDWQAARHYLQQCLAVFAAAQRPDLVANSLSSLGQILRRLGEWQELEQWAEQASLYHKQDNLSNKLAEDYGVLAQVALAQANWHKAQDWAQQALDCLAANERETNKTWQMAYAESQYRFTLAQAYSQLNQPQAAIENLERAQTVGSPEYDTTLYLDILSQLRQGYFQQRRYVQAFESKLRRQSIEQQYGLRAFVGAAWIQPQREAKLAPTAASQAYSQPGVGEMIAPEIAASGRQLDVERLIERIGRHDCKLIVIHGQSGVGKSSLVQGGLVPALKQKVMGTSDTVSVTMRVYSHWQEELARLFRRDVPPEHLPVEHLPVEHLPVEHLEDEAEISQSLIKYLQRTERLNLRTVLIFDQFEEFFFVYPNARKRRRFFEFIGECLKIPPVKVVLSMREDYLHYLLQCNYLDSMKVIGNDILSSHILYRVGNFSAKDARSIIQRLTEESSFHPEEMLIDKLVKELAGNVENEVRPIELQIVGAQLQAEGITTYDEYEDSQWTKNKLVKRYVEAVIEDCGSENQRVGELVLYLLTDENNTRPLKTRSDLASESKALPIDGDIDSQQLELVLKIFVSSGLVVKVPEKPENRYQLVHDYLVEFIHQQKWFSFVEELKMEREKRQQLKDDLTVAQAKLERVNQEARETKQRANQQLKEAEEQLADFRKKQQQAQAELAKTQLERAGVEARKHFEYDQIAALLSAMKAGQELKKWVEDGRPLEEYPATSPLLALQTILDNIRECNRLQHQRGIQAVAISPDGKQILTGSDDQTARLWDNQGNFIQLTGHKGRVLAVAISPDGKQILTGSDDQTAHLWDNQGNFIKELTGHQGGVNAVAFSPDGQQILTGSYDKTARMWDNQGNFIKELTKHEDEVLAVAISPDGKQILTGSKDKTARLWDNQGNFIELTGHKGAVYAVAFSLDGQQILTGSGDKTARLWDNQGKCIKKLTGHKGAVYAVAFSLDGQQILTGSLDHTARLWDNQGNFIELTGHKGGVRAVAFSPDGQQILTGSLDHTARLWDNQDSLIELTGHKGRVLAVAFSPDGKQILTGSVDKTARLWDNQGKLIKEFPKHWGGVNAVAFSPDGQQILTGSYDGITRLWDNQGNFIKGLTGHEGEVFAVAISRDSKQILTGSYDKTARLWDNQGNFIELTGHQDWVKTVAISPDGKQILTGSYDGTTRLWDNKGNFIKELIGHEGGVRAVAISPDGKQILTGSYDGTTRLWDNKGNFIKELTEHKGGVYAVGFSPDGKQILTSSHDGTTRLWNLQGKQIAEWAGYGTISPDWRTIALRQGNKVVLKPVYCNLDELLARGCDWLKDYLATAKVERVFGHLDFLE